jgi:hypothetical protein
MKEMNSQMLLQTLSKRILEFVGDKPFRSKNYYFDEERIQGYTEVWLFSLTNDFKNFVKHLHTGSALTSYYLLGRY